MSNDLTNSFRVTEKAQRPARMDGTCFYCSQPIGKHHESTCVLIHKTVMIRMTIDYEVTVPNSWDTEQIERHRNKSSWCASHAIDELQEIAYRDGCLCRLADFQWIEDVDGPFLDE